MGTGVIIYYLFQKRRMIYKNLCDKGQTNPNGKRTFVVAVDAITVVATTAVVIYFFTLDTFAIKYTSSYVQRPKRSPPPNGYNRH